PYTRKGMLHVTRMWDDTDGRLLAFRELVKATLPQLYDAYWTICDAGQYWHFPLMASRLRRLKPLNQLLRSGTRTVRWAYDEFIETAAMARAGDVIARAQKDEGVGNYWRFHFRNRMAADGLRHYFRLLDQTTHHLCEISNRALLL